MLKKWLQALMPAKKMIEMFSLNIESNRPIEDINKDFPQICEQNKFALLQTYIYHEIVENKGFPIKRKVFIYEICQAKTASLMLTDYPHFSIFMPCKIAIYEQDNKVVIATMNMGLMLDAVKKTPQLYNDAKGLFYKMNEMMKSLS